MKSFVTGIETANFEDAQKCMTKMTSYQKIFAENKKTNWLSKEPKKYLMVQCRSIDTKRIFIWVRFPNSEV